MDDFEQDQDDGFGPTVQMPGHLMAAPTRAPPTPKTQTLKTQLPLESIARLGAEDRYNIINVINASTRAPSNAQDTQDAHVTQDTQPRVNPFAAVRSPGTADGNEDEDTELRLALEASQQTCVHENASRSAQAGDHGSAGSSVYHHHQQQVVSGSVEDDALRGWNLEQYGVDDVSSLGDDQLRALQMEHRQTKFALKRQEEQDDELLSFLSR